MVPLNRLTGGQRTELESAGLPIYDCTESQRSHPILDIQLAAKVVEGLRESLELRVARRHLAFPSSEWLVLDGSISGLGESLSSTVAHKSVW